MKFAIFTLNIPWNLLPFCVVLAKLCLQTAAGELQGHWQNEKTQQMSLFP